MDQPKSPHEPFEDAIRKRMENHRLSVDKSVWQAIRRRLPAHSHRHRLLFPLLGGVAAAAVVLLMLIPRSLFVPAFDATDATDADVAVVDEKPDVLTTPAEADLASLIPAVSVAINKRGVTKPTTTLKDEIERHEDINLPIVIIPADVSETSQSVVSNEPANETSASRETNTINAISSAALQEVTADWTIAIPRKRPQTRMIAAVIGTGVGGSTATAMQQPLDFRSELIVSNATFASNYTYMLSPRDFSNREFLPPISIGLKLRSSIVERLAFETGIVYSFLMTRLSGGGWENLDATLQLHYLGVPLQLVNTVLIQGPWEVHVSGGVMPEKGLRSIYHQYRKAGNTLITTEAYTRIEGWQLSMLGGAGISYRLQENMSLYLDPQLSWYFNMKQPFSIRTEMPLQIGVQAGLRISL